MALNQYAPLMTVSPADPDYTQKLAEQTTNWSVGAGYYIPGSGYGSQGISLPYSNDYLAAAGDGGNNSLGSIAQASGGLLSGAGGAGSSLGTLGMVGGAIGTAANIYSGASTNTGSSVLSGAAQGALIGTEIFPGIGTAIGAVAGGLLGFFGSKSKKSAEKKAFQQEEELRIAPEQQQEANYLQNQGLLQKAVSNYSSGYQPGGYQYTNSLLKGANNAQNKAFGQPTAPASLPNFGTGPSNIATGKMVDTTQGLPASQASGLLANGNLAPINASQMPTVQAPSYTGNKQQDAQNLQNYQQQYAQAIQQQNQQLQMNSLSPFSQYYGGGQ